jgi:hypothetical protein
MRTIPLVVGVAVILVVGVAVIGGCATYPPAPNATVSVPRIASSILNELNCAVQNLRHSRTDLQAFEPNDDWSALMDLSLQASIEGVASPSISLLGPFNSIKAIPAGGTVGSFTGAVGAAFDQTRTNLRDYKVYIDINKLAQYACEAPDQRGIYLAGELGLNEWLTPSFEEQETTRKLAPPNLPLLPPFYVFPSPRYGLLAEKPAVLGGASSFMPTISATFTFMIKASGSLGGSFTLTRVSGGSTSLFSLTRTDTNFANIVLTPASYNGLVDVAGVETRLQNALLSLQLTHISSPISSP